MLVKFSKSTKCKFVRQIFFWKCVFAPHYVSMRMFELIIVIANTKWYMPKHLHNNKITETVVQMQTDSLKLTWKWEGWLPLPFYLSPEDSRKINKWPTSLSFTFCLSWSKSSASLSLAFTKNSITLLKNKRIKEKGKGKKYANECFIQMNTFSLSFHFVKLYHYVHMYT